MFWTLLYCGIIFKIWVTETVKEYEYERNWKKLWIWLKEENLEGDALKIIKIIKNRKNKNYTHMFLVCVRVRAEEIFSSRAQYSNSFMLDKR